MNESSQDQAESIDEAAPNNAGAVANFAGFILMGEGVLLLVASIPLLWVFGLGIFLLPAGAGTLWAGLVLAGVRKDNSKVASVVTLLAGGGVALVAFFLSVLASCASFVNCGNAGSGILLYAPPGAVAAFHLFCAAALWRKVAR